MHAITLITYDQLMVIESSDITKNACLYIDDSQNYSYIFYDNNKEKEKFDEYLK